MRVVLGLERLLASDRLHNKRIRVGCNQAAVDHDLQSATDLVATKSRGSLRAIFSPQHGLRSDVQENMIESPHGRDDVREIPVYSLYSETREPTTAMLRDIDVLVIDLQ